MGAKTTKDIAEWVCRSGYQDFNQELVDYTKNMALSHLGMTVAGSTMPFGKIALEYVKGQNCPAEAGVLGGGFQTLAEYAALANGSFPIPRNWRMTVFQRGSTPVVVGPPYLLWVRNLIYRVKKLSKLTFWGMKWAQGLV